MNTGTLKPHKTNEEPYGGVGKYQIMPPLPPELYETLKADIAENGVLLPVEYDEGGNILDGHNREQICRELGIKDFPCFVRRGMTEEEKLSHVRRLNIVRRHFNQEQKREIIRQQLRETPERSDRQIAVLLGVSHVTVSDQRKDLESIGQIDQCKKRETSDGRNYPSERKKLATPIYGTSGKQKEIITEMLSKIEGGDQNAKIWADKLSKGQTTIHAAHKKINHRPEEAPPDLPQGEYDVILADPPWRYEFSETNMRAIENQYPTMELETINRLDIPAAESAVLFLWATAPKLEEAMQVLNAWGFTYRTCAVWDKEKIGMGYWFRGQHELLLVGVKGNYSVPLPANRHSSVIRFPRSEHSKKPVEVYEIIERMFPHGKYIELFARNQRPGWGNWGLEAPRL